MRRWMFWMFAALVLAVLPATALARDESAVRVTLPGGRALRFGDRGQAVADLQRLLRSAGFDPGVVDGVFGPLTEAAVKQAQESLGLAVDGKAGNLTVGAVQASSAAPRATEQSAAGAAQAGPSRTLVVHKAGETGGAPGQGSTTIAAMASKDVQRFALTFNGAPDPQLLPTLLDALERHAMQATFFLYGQSAEQAPDLVARIAAAGHEVASNGPSAADMTGLTPAQMITGLRQASRSLKAGTGTDSVYFRPPLGRVNPELLQAATAQGLKLVLWTNVTVQDDPAASPADLAEQLAATVYPGAVVMLHQDRPATVEALDLLLDKLQADGYQSVALSELDRP